MVIHKTEEFGRLVVSTLTPLHPYSIHSCESETTA